MGLDWHSQIRATRKYKEDYVRKYYAEELEQGVDLEELIREEAPKTMKPCSIVGAKKMAEYDDFREMCEEELKARMSHVAEQKERRAKGQGVNEQYIEYWENMTVDSLMEENKDKWFCDRCPLLKELQGADSADSLFIGLTVSSCDFRGKRIGSDYALSAEIRDLAYEEHYGKDLLELADMLEEELEFQGEIGNLEKVPYAEYAKKFDSDKFAQMFSKKMTEKEYEKALHWREKNLREAIHWLRTLEKYGVDMGTSY